MMNFNIFCQKFAPAVFAHSWAKMHGKPDHPWVGWPEIRQFLICRWGSEHPILDHAMDVYRDYRRYTFFGY